MARGRCPKDLVHDDGFGSLPGLHQAVDVLMMVEWISAAPVDQLYLGKRDALAVVINRHSGVQQQVRYARHRDIGIDRAASDRSVERRYRRTSLPHAVHRTVAESEAAAGEPDLAEDCGQYDGHPDRLLAVIGTLQRPGGGDERARGRHAAC